MDTASRSALIVTAVVAASLLLFFGGGTMTGTMMRNGMMESASAGGISWMWTSALLAGVMGAVLFFLIFGRKQHDEQE
jgi:hypothetical protein